jgi:hypothetical protein
MKPLAALLLSLPLVAVAQSPQPPAPDAPTEAPPSPQQGTGQAPTSPWQPPQQPPAYPPPPPAYPPPGYVPVYPYPPPPPPYPPPPPPPPLGTRSPWYIGFGFGSGPGWVGGQGHDVALSSVAPGDGFLFAFNFKVGATLSQKLLVGFDTTSLGAVANQTFGGVTYESSAIINNFDAMATYFPWEQGFFVRGGLGLAWLSLSSARYDWWTYQTLTSADYTGLSTVVGLGYAFWLGRSFNLTLDADFSYQYYGARSIGPETSDALVFFLGFDWY